MNQLIKRKRILIIVTWIIFMLISSTVYYFVENHIYTERVKKELLEQAGVISMQNVQSGITASPEIGTVA